jgi:hypothetical protein
MRRKFQVFISSTYLDLKDARQMAMMAVLATHNIPTGMELFLADNQSLWDYIKSVIDDCDIYVLVVAGRYGSIMPDSNGISYTEMEYEYAISKGKPVLCFLQNKHQNLAQYKRQAPATQAQLDQFRTKLEQQAVSRWNRPPDLENRVQNAIINLQDGKHFAADGWIQASILSRDYQDNFATLFDNLSKAAQTTNAILQEQMKIRFQSFVDEVAHWSKGYFNTSGETYHDLLPKLYRQAESNLVSTSIMRYTNMLSTSLNDLILAAHKRSPATVTRIFVFNSEDQITEEHILVMKAHARRTNKNGEKINVLVYVDNNYEGFDLTPITRSDFVIIDDGKVVGITVDSDEIGAEFYFDQDEPYKELEGIRDALMQGSEHLDTFLENRKTK